MADDEYPYSEHAKLQAVSDLSQAIGEFIDLGLPKMQMAIYERVTYDCECSWCERGAGLRSAWHTEKEKETIVKGVVQVTEWHPTHRTVLSMLAEYFEIDQKKIDAEKEVMLDAMRKANAPSTKGSQ